MAGINYQRELDRKLADLMTKNETPTLFLHACCAPCSSYVLEYLASYFHITVFFYNPNISLRKEYEKRIAELRRLAETLPVKYPLSVVEGVYEPERFFAMARGMEKLPEGGERCFACYRLRLEETARLAAAGEYDYFTTTLSISPLKNAVKLNEIGGEMEEFYGIPYLYSDFKKRNGYKRSIELSREYDLYRQDYCGCVFSRTEREEKKGCANGVSPNQGSVPHFITK